MRFSTYEMKYGAKYIADNLEYRGYFDSKTLAGAKTNIAAKIYERLTHIEAQFPNEKIITICKNNEYFKDFFESLEKENIYYPEFSKNFNLYYQLTTVPKNKILDPSKNYTEQTRFVKKLKLITESLESYSQDEEDYFLENDLDFSVNTSDYDDEDEKRVFVSNPSSSIKVDIDKDTQHYINELLSVTDYVFLAGGKVIDLIKNEDKSTDRDFVIAPVIGASLEALQYKKDRLLNSKKNNYYKKEPIAIDVCIINYIETHIDSWMFANVAKRDFTICMAFIDKSGFVYDPTNCALHDIERKILRFNDEDAVAKLYEDPCRIIRAMKYIERGYIPDQKLDFALRLFDYLKPEQKGHLYSVTRKLLKNSTPDQKNNFIRCLDKYGQLKTLFNLTLHSPDEEVVKILEKLVEKQPRSSCLFTKNRAGSFEVGFSGYFMNTIKRSPTAKQPAAFIPNQKHRYKY